MFNLLLQRASWTMEQQLQQPALATPPGVVSHFPNTFSSSQVWFYPAAFLTSVVPGVLFILRIYTKLRIVGALDITDWMLSLAWPFFIALIGLGWGVVSNGGGAHQWDIRNADYIKVTYYYYLIEIVYCPCMFFVKSAILIQYQRTFSPHRSVNPFMWWSTKIIIGVTGIYYILSTFLTAFGCSPREAGWNPLITDARCLNNSLLVIITSIFNILSDIVILLLPARAVWKLQIPTRKKTGIIALFALGLFACISNGMIIYYFLQASGPAETADISYWVCWAGFWGYAEISFGMVVSSAILLPRFFKDKAKLLRTYWSSFSKPFHSLGSRVFGASSNETKGSTHASSANASKWWKTASGSRSRGEHGSPRVLGSKQSSLDSVAEKKSHITTMDVENALPKLSVSERQLSISTISREEW